MESLPQPISNKGGKIGIVKVPTMYPSSQTCSCCGYKTPMVKNLAVRKWECQSAGVFSDDRKKERLILWKF
ncbi:MAG: zinc ribbon domain-containing protein [Eubacteriales bacterium]|nr:zinc ribbon domain-containing protein [Eubacteriales bacterium]